MENIPLYDDHIHVNAVIVSYMKAPYWIWIVSDPSHLAQYSIPVLLDGQTPQYCEWQPGVCNKGHDLQLSTAAVTDKKMHPHVFISGIFPLP
jgi:hypothetical protein